MSGKHGLILRSPVGLITAALVIASILAIATCWVAPWRQRSSAHGAVRRDPTTLPDDRGTLFGNGTDAEMASLGIALNAPNSAGWARMSAASTKVSHGLVSFVRPDSDHQWPWFPYDRFISFEKNEVASGRPPLRLTATYQGRSRPVYWNWSLGFPSPDQRPPVSDQTAWEQGVNVGDDRYARWLVDNYITPVMFHQYFSVDGQPIDVEGPYPNEWLGMDEIAINYHLYGVLDDDGRWVPMDAGPVMDSPFPSGSGPLHQMYRQFFTHLHEALPGIRIMANAGSPDNWHMFQKDLGDVDGLAVEDISHMGQSAGRGGDDDFASFPWLWAISAYTGRGKVALLRSLLNPLSPNFGNDLRTALVTYLLLSGPNSAWAPEDRTTQTEIPPRAYAAMKSSLGRATSTLAIWQYGAGVYSRRMSRGIVYLNESPHSSTVSCPRGATCRDHSGRAVGAISIPAYTGDYLLIGR